VWKLIYQLWTTEKLPEDWKTVLLCPVHEKEDKEDCNNYLRIALLSIAFKVFANCILSGIKTKSEQTMDNFQGGLINTILRAAILLLYAFENYWTDFFEIHE